MKRLLVGATLLALAGCGHVNTQVEKVTVDGTTCVKAQSSRGIAIDCDWPLKIDPD